MDDTDEILRKIYAPRVGEPIGKPRIVLSRDPMMGRYGVMQMHEEFMLMRYYPDAYKNEIDRYRKAWEFAGEHS
jgi:hypothetical protein